MPAIFHPQAPLTSSCLRVLRRPLRLRDNHHYQHQQYRSPQPSRHYATDKKPRTLEKPTRFNPPSHGARRVRPRQYPGPRLSEKEAAAQQTRRYPNMMPPEGSFMHWFLTNRAIHLWITLSTLTALAGYTLLHSFLHTTAFRDELPSADDAWRHPLRSAGTFISVYRKHVEHESAAVGEKRARKLDDARKRKEFMREHGVEPGFLTGGWMGKFGTVEGDKLREEMAAAEEARRGDGLAEAEGGDEAAAAAAAFAGGEGEGVGEKRERKRKVKRWFGIWE